MPPSSQSIPTSFVPKQPVKSAARFTKSGGNIFMVIAVLVLGLTVAGALGVFLYGKYLEGVERSKSVQLAAAEGSINVDEVETFIRSRDRFAASGDLLDQHVSLSNFFDLLERITLVNVRFDSFSFGYLPESGAQITLSGGARSFNALAAQSAAFSSERYIKRAIFSGIQVAENGTVGFTVTAELDPRLLAFAVDEVPVAPSVTVPVATSTPATSTPASTTTPPL